MADHRVFAKLRSLLFVAIPAVLKGSDIGEPITILRLNYYDSHAPCAYLDFRCLSNSTCDAIVAKRGAAAFDWLWGSGEECGKRLRISLPSDPENSSDKSDLAACFRKVYRLLSNERKFMPQYRRCLQAVAYELNQFDWTATLSVTDGFVIVPADGSMYFCDDESEIVCSVPPDKLTFYLDRGYLSAIDLQRGEQSGSLKRRWWRFG